MVVGVEIRLGSSAARGKGKGKGEERGQQLRAGLRAHGVSFLGCFNTPIIPKNPQLHSKCLNVCSLLSAHISHYPQLTCMFHASLSRQTNPKKHG